MLADSSETKDSNVKPTKERNLGIPGALFWGAATYILPQIALLFFAPFILEFPYSQNVTNFLLTLVYEGTLIAFLATILVRWYGLSFKTLGIGKIKLEHFTRALLAFAIYLPLSLSAAYLMSLVIPFDPSQAQELGFSYPVGFETVLVFIALVILAPLAEELLFRGFIFKGFRKRLSFWPASILVSIIFAIAHGQVNVAIDVFALSLVLCYLREKTGSLWPAIFLHALKNGIAYVLIFVYGFIG